MDLRAQRAAENEDLFRRVNERVAELSEGLDALTLVCECADADCAAKLGDVSAAAYRRVRAHGDRFFVASGHERSDVEVVVERQERYVVVEKRGEAGEAAREADPRSG
ncbi:MAG TPA: hypothetical protein VFL60_04785 [Gaiellaceae bacterium]|nr:hypothetical protein [Gaiellaceae bacterium]